MELFEPFRLSCNELFMHSTRMAPERERGEREGGERGGEREREREREEERECVRMREKQFK